VLFGDRWETMVGEGDENEIGRKGADYFRLLLSKYYIKSGRKLRKVER
jgi:hypothetical protein